MVLDLPKRVYIGIREDDLGWTRHVVPAELIGYSPGNIDTERAEIRILEDYEGLLPELVEARGGVLEGNVYSLVTRNGRIKDFVEEGKEVTVHLHDSSGEYVWIGHLQSETAV